MKKNVNRITYLLIFISMAFLAINLIVYKLYSSLDNFIIINIILHFLFVYIIVVIARILISKNDAANNKLLQQQKIVNKEISQAKERYDIVAKATSDTVWDWKFKDNFFTWNNGIKTMFGYDEQDIVETSNWWFDKIHPEDSIRVSVKLYLFKEQKTEKWQDEYRFKCKDGSYKYVLDRGFLVFNSKGVPSRMIGAMQDITNKKIEEERLKLMETVVINAVDAVLIMSADIKGKSPEIIYANQIFCKMTGYEIHDVIGSDLDNYIDSEKQPHILENITEYIHNKKEFEIETIGKNKEGHNFWVKFSMVPVFDEDKIITHWISIQRDISSEKKLAKEKEQLIVELSQNNKDLRQFSYITSHNLRAPLSNLIGLLEFVKDKDIQDEELKTILEGFSTSTLLLNETIEDLNKVVMIRDNPSLIKEHVSIANILQKVRNQVGYIVEEEYVEINQNITDKDYIYANKSYLESIMLNLLSNSLKFKKDNGQVKINITLNENEDHTEMIFEDNGIGIDLEKFKDKIFGLYQKFHDSPGSKGLGLYLVKSQIESMGGTIHVESNLNEGTKFTIKFKKNA